MGCQLKMRVAAWVCPAREKASIDITHSTKPTRKKKKRWAYAVSYNCFEQPLKEHIQSYAVIQQKTNRPLNTWNLQLQICKNVL